MPFISSSMQMNINLCPVSHATHPPLYHYLFNFYIKDKECDMLHLPLKDLTRLYLSSQVLPSLRSYSLYTAVGIAAVYILQATFFVAWLAIDQKRIDERRDGTFCWKSYGKTWEPNKFSQMNILQRNFKALGNLLTKKSAKISVALLTVILTAFGESIEMFIYTPP